ncbi:MAG: 4Fe-4S binding protein [Spirochaetales bacterium]|nr:4Fe-4S binding protein [Spirochaetales bacterium]
MTDACQGCLAHPCKEICPKGAISFKGGRSHIDQEKCIKCGMCMSSCKFHAIEKI